MTLHWWMHWFWITHQLWVYCALTPSPTRSISTKLQDLKVYNNTTEPPPVKNVTGFPTNTTTAAIPIIKSRKPLKKHELVTTASPIIVKTSTVINDNETENETIPSSATINNSSVEDNNATSQNLVINLEAFGSKKENLTAAGITGITLGCVSIIGIICAVSFVLYRNYGFNRPQVLNDHCSNPDSSGYIDDSSVRENSEEMYSLDNDSFLNSLEAMTIQNLWTDSVKHTKL